MVKVSEEGAKIYMKITFKKAKMTVWVRFC